MNKRVVITGPPWSGKTTVINTGAKMGFRVVPEAAMQIISEMNREFGVEAQIEWRARNRAKFQELVAERQVQLEDSICESNKEIVFLDRGLPDGAAYCRLFSLPIPPLIDQIAPRRYTNVFSLSLLPDFENRSEMGRMGTKEDAELLQTLIFSAYSNFGYAPIVVGVMPLTARVEFILAAIINNSAARIP